MDYCDCSGYDEDNHDKNDSDSVPKDKSYDKISGIRVNIICPRCNGSMVFLSRKGDFKSAKKQCVFCGNKILVKDNILIHCGHQ